MLFVYLNVNIWLKKTKRKNEQKKKTKRIYKIDRQTDIQIGMTKKHDSKYSEHIPIHQHKHTYIHLKRKGIYNNSKYL